MEKQTISFDNFLFDVHPQSRPFVEQIHETLLQNGCTVKLTQAKNGYVVSYTYMPQKRVIINFVFRKKGLMIRIYGDNAGAYEEFLETLPGAMRKAIEKAPVCKRLIDPAQCSSHCPMGNTFSLGGVQHKKCRYSNFMFLVEEDSYPFLKAFLEHELRERMANIA